MKKIILLLLPILMVALINIPETAFASPVKEFVPTSSPTTENLNAVWGFSENNVYAVGDKGTILHYNGNDWTSMVSNTTVDLTSIWGVSNTNIYAVGSVTSGDSATGHILHYNGTKWSTVATIPKVNFYAVGGSGSFVCAAGMDRTVHTAVIYLKEGSEWKKKYTDSFELNSFNDIWGYSYHGMHDYIYIVGGNFYNYNSNVILFQPELIKPVTVEKRIGNYILNGIWGAAPSEWNLFAVGGRLQMTSTILNYDFSTWREDMGALVREGKIDIRTELKDVWGSSSSDVYTVGTLGKIYHYNGTRWNAVESGTKDQLNGIWANSSENFFVVGNSGAILRLNFRPDKPVNNLPADSAGEVSLTARLESSAFSDPNSGNTHAASQWQITTTPGDYSAPVYDSGTDADHKVSVVVPSGTFSLNSVYYWRVRYRDNKDSWSEWSEETSFTTTLVPPEENLPKPGLKPDNPFYFLDTWRKKISLFFTFGAEKKAEKALGFAKEKLAEIKALAEEKKEKALEKARKRHRQMLELAKEKANEAKEKGKNVEEISKKIEETVAAHQEVLLRVIPPKEETPPEPEPTPEPETPEHEQREGAVEHAERAIPECGNGIFEPVIGEECDDGNLNDDDGCSATCSLEVCGNGKVEGVEECDDGNNIKGDGCTPYCTLDACGDGITSPGEECDDGNLMNGDGCGSDCMLEVCGNGVVNMGEECDDGNNINGDGCTSYCMREVCGNGRIDVTVGEECDDGNLNDDDGCSATCSLEVCGNGKVEGVEECDDGNNMTDDGCSPSCMIEVSIIDADDDGVPDISDNCPNVFNPNQIDVDGDTQGDACDSTPNGPDADDDGVPDISDNCPNVFNPNQEDIDGDVEGDACDSDDDGDGIIDSMDPCPNEYGPIINDGCPYGDYDDDGVTDDVDECIAEAGPVSNNGCPL